MVIFAISFALGIWLLQQQAVLPDFAWAWLLVLVLINGSAYAGASLLAKTVREQARSCSVRFALQTFRFFLIATLGCGAGFYHAAWQAQQRLVIILPDEWQGRDVKVIGVVAELPRSHPQGQRFKFTVERVLTPQASVPPRLYLSTYFDAKSAPLEMHANERWQLTLRLKQPHGTINPYGFDFEAWALENDIRAVGYVHNKGLNVRLDNRADGLSYRIESWRETVRDKFSKTLGDAPYTGVLSALAIGDQSSIPQAQWQVFTRTGVNHLMSISGLHITMLASLAYALGYWLWRRSTRLTLRLPARKAAALLALLIALGYALLSGFAVPAQRTVYMVGAIAAALWLNRNFSFGQMLTIALLGVLIPDPWAVLSPGFWLSFGAVALILYVTAHRIGKAHWLAEYARVQWAMMVGLIPLLLGLFQQVSLVSPVANAFAIPLVSLAIVPLALLGAILPWDMPLWLAHLAMEGVMRLLVWLSALPQAVWIQHAPPAWSIVLGMLGAVWILLPRGFPSRWLGLLLLLPMFLVVPPPPAPGTLRLIVFDVGQGLAVAVQTREHALLYDTGPDFSGESDSGNRILIPTLRAFGIARLDGLILTHDDIDHTGGAATLMQAMPVGWVSSSLSNGHPLLQQAADTQRCIDGQSWSWDGVRFDILHPTSASYQQKSGKAHDNDQGCVLRISIGDQHILLAADIEQASEQRLLKEHAAQLPAALLVVPHHGSKTSSGIDFVTAVLPDYAVFTTGYRNRFGHPKPEIVERYADSGAQLLRSDQDGAILVEMSAHGLQVECYRQTHHRYWTHIAQP